MRAEKEGMIGISGTNTSPLMNPTRSMEAGLGTNPLSFAAPAENGDSFVLDMATTAVAVGKIEIKRRKGDPLPHGWAHDTKGNITTDAGKGFLIKLFEIFKNYISRPCIQQWMSHSSWGH